MKWKGKRLFFPAMALLLVAMLIPTQAPATVEDTQPRPQQEETSSLVLTPRYPSVSFEDEIICNVYFTLEGEASESGMVIFDSAKTDGTVKDAATVLRGAKETEVEDLYRISTKGIPAKNLGDPIYFKLYAKDTDGVYTYSKLMHYCPEDYALDRLKNSDSGETKALCSAMLQYGAAAQSYFSYNTDDPANASLTKEQRLLAGEYAEGMVGELIPVEKQKLGSFSHDKEGYTKRYPSVSFDGVFGINYYVIPALPVEGDVTLYYWDAQTYDSADELTVENAVGRIKMKATESGTYKGTVQGIAARRLDGTVLAAAVYESAGVRYCSGVMAYSVGAYCVDRINFGSKEVRELAAATAVYGCRAKEAFGAYNAYDLVADKVESLQSDSTLTISAMSDVHYGSSDAFADRKLKTAFNMGALSTRCDVDLILNLGDMIAGRESVGMAYRYLEKMMDAASEVCEAPLYFLRGNHDDNGWYSYGGYGGSYLEDEIISNTQWAELIGRYVSDDIVTDPDRPNGGYGYFDHEASKIRIFLLNTSDIPYILEEDGTYRYHAYRCSAFSNEQIRFVANGLQFADKTDPDEWAALFVSHVPLDTTNESGYRFGIKDSLVRGQEYMLAVINAYQKGTAFAASGSSFVAALGERMADFSYSVDVDYSSNGTGNVLGFLSGHTHADNFSRRVGYQNSLSYGYNFLSLFGEMGFANFVVDREKGCISVVNYGMTHAEQTDAVTDPPDSGSIKSGEWVVKLNKNLPTGENLSRGLSEVWTTAGYTFDASTKVDLETMEVTGLSTAAQSHVALKVIPIKPFTRYALPLDFQGSILAFDQHGSQSYYITPETGEDYLWFQSGARQYYIAITLHTATYSDYENFKMQEIYSGMEF